MQAKYYLKYLVRNNGLEEIGTKIQLYAAIIFGLKTIYADRFQEDQTARVLLIW